MSTLTVYPSVDGIIRNAAAGSNQAAWTALIAAATGTVKDDSTASQVMVQARNNVASDNTQYCDRQFFTWDTSGLPDGAVITDVKLGVYVETKQAGAGGDVNVFAHTVASTSALAMSDFGLVGSTALATAIDFSTLVTGAYNEFTLNAAGLAAINLTGSTKLCLRTSFDYGGTVPASGTQSGITSGRNVEYTGTGSDPYLTITYVTVSSESIGVTDSASPVDKVTVSALSASDSVAVTDTAATAVIVRQSGSPSVGVASGSNDVLRRLGGSAFVVDGNSQGVGVSAGRYDATYNKYGSGMRFQGIAIPRGATILSATLSLVSAHYDGSQTGAAAKTRIRAQAADNPGAFTDQTDFDSRIFTGGNPASGIDSSKVTTAVDWDNITAWSTNGQTKTSPDIATVIQELVNRSGWASGNALVLFWEDFEGRTSVDLSLRSAADYENASYTEPTLSITWSLVGATESVTVTESATRGDVVTPITASDSATVTDASAVLAKIDPTVGSVAIRTTGSPSVIETKSGDTMGGVAQNHNAFPGAATLPNGNVLIAYQKGYTHGGGNCVVEWAILAPDGSVVTAPSVLRYASGTQNNNVYPALPGWNSADVSLVYIPRTREVMCLWNEASYTSAWGYPPTTLQRMAAWYDTVTETWSSPADVGMGFSNSPSLYAIAPTPPIVDGNGDLLAAVYHDLSTVVSCVKSTNDGRSWTVIGTIASSGVCDETALIRLDDGTLRAVIRSDVPYKLRICASTGSHDGSTWGSVTDLVATPAGSGGTFYGITGRPSLVQDATGRVYLGARAMVGSAGDDNTYDVVFYSDDRLSTLSAPIDPYTGSTATVGRTDQTTRGYCVYGAFALLADGSVGYLWAEEFFDHVANVQPAVAQLLYRVLTTVTSGRASETATVTDAASVTVGVGAIVKTASEGATVTDTASGVAVTRYVVASDSALVTDYGGGIASPVTTYTRPFYAPLDRSSVTAPLDLSNATAPLDLDYTETT